MGRGSCVWVNVQGYNSIEKSDKVKYLTKKLMAKSCKISTKRKSPTPWLPFSRLLLCPLPDISLVTWDLGPLSQHHCLKDMLPMKIYPYLSDCRKIKNETDVKYVETCAICRSIGQQIKQWERNVVFGWAGVCGEGWKASFLKSACAGGYPRPYELPFSPASWSLSWRATHQLIRRWLPISAT